MTARFALLFSLALPLLAQPAPQQFYDLRDFRLSSGATIPVCRLGYRTYGALNAARDNAVLWPTWFSGASADLAAFVGPGNVVDSSKYFVITVDALANGVSCSPSNTTGTFPAVTIRDMVESQYRLAREKFQISRLHAVVGISMGGMQTFEWMVAHPGFLARAVPIIGTTALETPDLLLWTAELSAIEAVQKAGADPRQAMRAVGAMHQFALYTPDYYVREKPPAAFPQILARIDEDARQGMDPRDWAAQLEAMLAHDVYRTFGGSLEKAAAAVRARTLVVLAPRDHMVNPHPALRFAAAGLGVLRLESDCGHMATSCQSAAMTEAVAAFLAAP
jgi:homoserine O-acetyltransferase